MNSVGSNISLKISRGAVAVLVVRCYMCWKNCFGAKLPKPGLLYDSHICYTECLDGQRLLVDGPYQMHARAIAARFSSFFSRPPIPRLAYVLYCLDTASTITNLRTWS
jgi:hypothetical protein